MVFFLLLSIMLSPLFVQIKYGVRAFSGWTKLKFWEFTLSCFFAEILLAILLFIGVMFVESLFQSTDQSPRCGMGYAGIAIFGIPISVLILIVALIQYGANKNNS